MQTFSLPLAAALGCCSFEAYNSPYVLHGVKEVSPCKTETVYMVRNCCCPVLPALSRIAMEGRASQRALCIQDREFMNLLVAGVMEVRTSCPVQQLVTP